MRFGDTLRDLRQQRGMTQKELGNTLGVSAQMIAQYENGKRKPKLGTLQQIAASLNVPTDYFINRYDGFQLTDVELNNRTRGSFENLLTLYRNARDNLKEEVIFLTAEIQDLDERIEKLEKKLREKPDTTDPDHK